VSEVYAEEVRCGRGAEREEEDRGGGRHAVREDRAAARVR